MKPERLRAAARTPQSSCLSSAARTAMARLPAISPRATGWVRARSADFQPATWQWVQDLITLVSIVVLLQATGEPVSYVGSLMGHRDRHGDYALSPNERGRREAVGHALCLPCRRSGSSRAETWLGALCRLFLWAASRRGPQRAIMRVLAACLIGGLTMVLAGLVEAVPRQRDLELIPASWRCARLSRIESAKWRRADDSKPHRRSRRTGNAPASGRGGGRP